MHPELFFMIFEGVYAWKESEETLNQNQKPNQSGISLARRNHSTKKILRKVVKFSSPIDKDNFDILLIN